MDEIMQQPQPGQGPAPRVLNWKIIVAILIFCLAAVAVFVLVASRGKKNGSGQQVVAVNPYPAGTQLQATSTLPSNFPKDVLREQYPVEKSTIVNYPDGRTNVTVSYLSPNTVFSLLSVYTEYFKSSYWKMQSSELLQNSGVVVAKNGGAEVVVTIAPAKDGTGSKVTFSYTYQ